MSEAKGPPDLEAEIEAVKTTEGYNGLNNFRAIMPGGYRYAALQEDPDYGNTKTPDTRKGLSLREFTEHANLLREQLGIDGKRVKELQERVINTGDRASTQALNDYIFSVYRALRLENFSHPDCSA